MLVSTKPGPDLSLSLIFHISMSIEYCHRVVVVAVTFAIVVVVVAVTFAFFCNLQYVLPHTLFVGCPCKSFEAESMIYIFARGLFSLWVLEAGRGRWQTCVVGGAAENCGEFEHEVTVYPSLHLQNRAPLSKRRQ